MPYSSSPKASCAPAPAWPKLRGPSIGTGGDEASWNPVPQRDPSFGAPDICGLVDCTAVASSIDRVDKSRGPSISERPPWETAHAAPISRRSRKFLATTSTTRP